MIRVWWVIR